jgi:hypothetical protein
MRAVTVYECAIRMIVLTQCVAVCCCSLCAAQYDIHKESTIQVFTGPIRDEAKEKEEAEKDLSKDVEQKDNKAEGPSVVLVSPAEEKEAEEDALPPAGTRPFMVRQPTNEGQCSNMQATSCPSRLDVQGEFVICFIFSTNLIDHPLVSFVVFCHRHSIWRCARGEVDLRQESNRRRLERHQRPLRHPRRRQAEQQEQHDQAQIEPHME